MPGRDHLLHCRLVVRVVNANMQHFRDLNSPGQQSISRLTRCDLRFDKPKEGVGICRGNVDVSHSLGVGNILPILV